MARVPSTSASPKAQGKHIQFIGFILTMILAISSVVTIEYKVANDAIASRGLTYYVNNADFGKLGTVTNLQASNCTSDVDSYDSAIDSNNTCSLGAALALANAAAASSAFPVWVTLATGFSGGMISTPNSASTSLYMITTSINPLATINGAYYSIESNVVVDLQNKLGISTLTASGSTHDRSTTSIYINGKDIQLLNASNIYNGRSSIVVSSESQNVIIDGGSSLPSDGNGYATQQFLVIQNGAREITFSNYTVGNLYDGAADNCVSSAICFHPGSSSASVASQILIDNVTFTSTTTSSSGSRCGLSDSRDCVNSSLVFYNNSKVSGLEVRNSTFSNLRKGAKTDANVFFGDDGPAISDLHFHNNLIQNLTSCSTAGADYCSMIQLPKNVSMGGTNVIEKNRFVNDIALKLVHAITWDSNKTTSSLGLTASNLTIQDNHFDGFAGPSVYLSQAGTATVQRNTFGPTTYANSGGTNRIYEESGNNGTSNTATSGAMFANQGSYTNQLIRTWFPVEAKTAWQGGTCAVVVKVQAPTTPLTPSSGTVPTPPVTLDLFWTETYKAEVFVGRFTGVTMTNSNIVIPLDQSGLMESDGTVRSGFFRIQTHSEKYLTSGTGQLQSSQYSRLIPTPQGTCEPIDFTVEKKAYSDELRTEELAPGALLELGSPVYFSYFVTNDHPEGYTFVTVWDSDKDLVDGEPVCVDVLVNPLSVAICEWDTVVTRQ